MKVLLLFLVARPALGMDAVEVSGQIESEQAGPVRLELLSLQGPGQNPLLRWTGWAEGPGPFSLEVPAGLQDVKLRAALDLKRDGIGPDDPQIRVPIPLVVGREPIGGIVLKIRPPEHRAPALPLPARPSPPAGAPESTE